MLVRALLQTSLVLWLAQQTLQGGVKPQSVSWGRVLPARGVGIGVKPGVTGALGALGSRYGTKAMKTGIGRYPGAQLGVGGYRALGLGSRGLKPGYGTQGAYGASLGLGAGLANGVGLGLGQGGKRVYGAGLGTLPGYGALAGIGYPGARPGLGLGYPTGHSAKEQKPGVPTDDMGGPEVAGLDQAVQDLKRKKNAALGHLYGNRALLGPSAPELQVETGLRPAVLPPGREVKSLEKQTKGPSVSQIPRGESYDPTLSERRGPVGHGASLGAGGVRQQLPLDKDDVRGVARPYDPSIPQNQRGRNCARDLLPINRHELLGSEIQGSQSLPLQPHAGKDGKHLGHSNPQAERAYRPPLSHTQDVSSNIFSLPQSQGGYLSAAADGQAVKDFGLVAKDKSGPRIRGTVTVENPSRGGSLNLQGGVSFGRVNPGARGSPSLGVASVNGKEGKGFAAEGQEAKQLSHAEHELAKSKAVSVPGQTGRNTQASSYIGGPGNYLGASLGAGGYGPGLGQGAYLGGAAGRAAALGQGGYPHGVAGMSTGYGDGATGYLGAMAGNGYGGDAGGKTLSTGYGNGFSDGYGAGLGYPSELADVAESKAGKSEALSTGAYAGQVQGAYGALGAGLESTGGKYGAGAAQVPYGNAPVIPTGLEGDGGYPYGAQQLALGTEGAKTASKYGAAAGYGAQQTGYGAQLGATQDVLGEQAGKYGGVNGALGNGYKG